MMGAVVAGKTSLITGASSGIGRELARLSAADSRKLVLTARRQERLNELAAELEADRPGIEAVPIAADLAVVEGRRRLLAELEERGLAVDHLINNAGFGDLGGFVDLDPERQRRMVELNVAAVHELLLRLLPGMVERGYGRVLNVASTAGLQPVPFLSTYSAAKGFVIYLSEALWSELRDSGVTVTCLAPGKTATEFFAVNLGHRESVVGDLAAADPRQVAAAGYRGMMAGKRMVIPGVGNRLGAWGAKVTPVRWALAGARALFSRRAEDGR